MPKMSAALGKDTIVNIQLVEPIGQVISTLSPLEQAPVQRYRELREQLQSETFIADEHQRLHGRVERTLSHV